MRKKIMEGWNDAGVAPAFKNFFSPYDWETMLSRNPFSPANSSYSTEEYHKILCPAEDFPAFLSPYLELPLLTRLKGIGLLCGTDWTALYKNRFYYSRFDHSLGVALIIWHFTHDKAQTLAGLLHDVSTPVFSHVSDFRKGDALTQTATEEPNAALIRKDTALARLLSFDGLAIEQVSDYHLYPVADNEIPRLSADRLEYMYPSGMALDGSWTYKEISRTYKDLTILQNEDGLPELGFNSPEIAEEYTEHFCMIGHILQLNENKLALHLLGQIMNTAVLEGILQEEDFMTLSEAEVIQKMDSFLKENMKMPGSHHLASLYRTFRTMTNVVHSKSELAGHFCVNLKVKQRYINPLVRLTDGSAQRISQVSDRAKKIIQDFLNWEDTPWGCVKLAE